MAGVADHSDYRHDPWGRLHRTAEFLAATTYGDSVTAQAAVDRVAAVHRHVRGVAPDGRPYSRRGSRPRRLRPRHRGRQLPPRRAPLRPGPGGRCRRRPLRRRDGPDRRASRRQVDAAVPRRPPGVLLRRCGRSCGRRVRPATPCASSSPHPCPPRAAGLRRARRGGGRVAAAVRAAVALAAVSGARAAHRGAARRRRDPRRHVVAPRQPGRPRGGTGAGTSSA